MEISTIIGIIGTFLAFIEIWKPRMCVAIELKVDSLIDMANEYEEAKDEALKQASINAKYIFGEVLKGPQLKTYEELKADQYAALERYKSYALGYMALITHYIFLKPAKLIVSALNFIGKGKAVGGIGIILNLIGLYLGWIA